MGTLSTAPTFPSEELTQRARLFFSLAWTAIIVGTGALSAVVIAQPNLVTRGVLAMAALNLMCFTLLEVNRRGRTRVASWLLVLGFITLVTSLSVTSGGVASPGVTVYFIFVLLAGLLLGERTGIAVAVGCAMLGLGLAVAELAGVLPAQTVNYGPIARWLLLCLYMGIVIFLMRKATQALHGALRRAESELEERRATEQKLDLALEAGVVGIGEYDPQSGEFRGDDRAFALFGLPVSPDRVVSFDVWMNLVFPEDRPHVAQMLDALRGGAHRARAEYRIRRPDGTVRHLLSAVTATEDVQGNSARVVGLVVDVSDRKEAEAERENLVTELGERVKELRLLHGASRLLRDREWDQTVLAELAALIPPAWMYPEVCEARIEYGDVVASTSGWTESPWRQSEPFTTSEGSGVIEVCYREERPLRDEGPFLTEERAVLRSLAKNLVAYLERQLAERRRRALEHDLRQSQKMQALGTLAGGIAHDFNNILTAINGNTELARSETPSGSAASTYLEDVQRATARATDLVKRILTFSRRQDVERKVVSLAPVVDEALRLLRASLPRTIELQTSLAHDAPPILADSTQIHQIMMNLGTNAAHAMSETGGTLRVTVDRVAIDDGARHGVAVEPGVYVRLAVQDSGTGMSPEIVDRLFEPFFTTKGHAGTGLGLAVVHGIVRDHEGAITVQSEIGYGTTFEVLFPVVTEAPAEAPLVAAVSAAGEGRHVLYVDDEEAVAVVMSRVLQRLGYRCTWFTDVTGALHAFRTTPHEFDAVISDLAMPSMSGLELAQAVRAIRPDIPVAIASGYGDTDSDDARAAKLSARIRKPVSMAELSAAMAGIFASAR